LLASKEPSWRERIVGVDRALIGQLSVSEHAC
jgi:hypothetical protein